MKAIRTSAVLFASLILSSSLHAGEIKESEIDPTTQFFELSDLLGCEPPMPSILVYDVDKQRILTSAESVAVFSRLDGASPTGDRECGNQVGADEFSEFFGQTLDGESEFVALFIDLKAADEDFLSRLGPEFREKVLARRAELNGVFESLDRPSKWRVVSVSN